MTQVTITVRGEHIARVQPERATAHATVHHEGPTRDPVLAAALATSASVRALVEPSFDEGSGPITSWSAESAHVWSQRPWNQDGEQLPLVHHAELGLTVEFSDFAALARWVEDAARIDGVVIQHLSWDLTDATRADVTAAARSRAVEDAVAKATEYAAAVGLPAPTPVAIADPGMLGDRPASDGGAMPVTAMRAAKFEASDRAPDLALRPEEITVSCIVDARFVSGQAAIRGRG